MYYTKNSETAGKATHKYQEHIPSGFSYYVHSNIHPELNKLVHRTSSDPKEFVDCIEENQETF